MKIQWPDGKRFAFSIFDDTDLAVPGNYEKVYECLDRLGLRTTKSVWPITPPGLPARSPEGSSCEDREYLEHILSLQKKGFEIGYHLSSHSGLPRAEIVRALDRFKELFGQDPVSMSNHASSPEGIYWGPARLSVPQRWLYRTLMRMPHGSPYRGEDPQSPYFWGDVCRERVRYVRNFVFGEVDTLAACPEMPYRDEERPYVNAWYASTHAPEVETFVRAISEERQDQLEESGGVCILYTHFAAGFQKDGVLDARVERLLTRLAQKPGCFVPVGQVLDEIARQRKGVFPIRSLARQRLERKWFVQKIFLGGTS